MLKQVGPKTSPEGAIVTLKEAQFPKPFPAQLEYNCPVHENWNIVHTGMLIPECHQIYVCNVNCMRGVIMTADEMAANGRISAVMPTEQEVVQGKLEDVSIEGVCDILDHLPYRPKAVQLFLVCMHHFLGCESRYIFRELRTRYPDIAFLPCWMDPIMMKVALTPEQKQRKAMMEVLPDLPVVPEHVVVLGDNLRLPKTSDIAVLCKHYGQTLRQVQDCKSYADYLSLGDGALYLTRSPLSVYGLEALCKTNNRPYLYLPQTVDYDEIETLLAEFLAHLLPSEEDAAKAANAFASTQIPLCEEALSKAKASLGDTPIAIDYIGHNRPLGLAKLLLSHGFTVTRIYLDAISPEEEHSFFWLKEHAPDVTLQSTNHVKSRVLPRGSEEPTLAIGPKAAYFTDSPYFVNSIEGDGNFGYDGIRQLAMQMMDAMQTKKDTKALVQRKGLGNPCVL